MRIWRATAFFLDSDSRRYKGVRHNYASLGECGVPLAAGLSVVDGSSGSTCGFRFHTSLPHEIIIHFYQLHLLTTSLVSILPFFVLITLTISRVMTA